MEHKRGSFAASEFSGFASDSLRAAAELHTRAMSLMVLLLALSAAAAAAAAPAAAAASASAAAHETLKTAGATAWPQEFTITFVTKNGSVSGFLAYDWANKQQLIVHGPNAAACSAYTTESCLMLFNTQGTYVIIPSLQKCWLNIPGVGSLPPQWTTGGVFAGDEYVQGVGTCRAFTFLPTAHVYMETVPDGKPCVFVFPDPDMTYYFNPQSLDLATPDPSYFALPDYCSSDHTST